ncbi:hypothetical protein K461DRAFT_7214 [Myriangium duriaei CBS 260.36]|uniref:Uncharacterized protein n=1 Tax=Myriangium duriaei CBS 260.36 TaxID=1168546 RepID=A0A9P4J8K2_9PEZI|nr:hypothetical protein K461DRAFT_7214 [Myriangium duriaei CBS 260.36]
MSVTRQPRHRRPSWMRDANTYRIHLDADATRSEPPEFIDPDLEGYCYDPAYFASWELKSPLREKLPESLQGLIDDWSYAGAAVQTALHRITLLDHEGMDRGWPEKTTAHLSRTTSAVSSMCVPSPPLSTTSPFVGGSFSSSRDAARFRLPPLCMTSFKAPAFGHTNTLVETPPYSPEDAKPVDLPVDSPINVYSIDPFKLNERLVNFEHAGPTGAIGQLSPPLCPASPTGPPFDETSWERYLEQYKREMEGVQNEDAPRFRHLAHKVMVDYRVRLEEDHDVFDADTQKLFDAWWARMSAQQKQLQEDIDKVSMPTLAEIKHVRRVYGLHV